YLLFFSFPSTLLLLRSTLFPYTTLFRSSTDMIDLHTIPLGRVTRPFLDGGPASGLPVSEDRARFSSIQARQESSTIGSPDELARSEEHTSELQSRENLVCRLLLEKKKKK